VAHAEDVARRLLCDTVSCNFFPWEENYMRQCRTEIIVRHHMITLMYVGKNLTAPLSLLQGGTCVAHAEDVARRLLCDTILCNFFPCGKKII